MAKSKTIQAPKEPIAQYGIQLPDEDILFLFETNRENIELLKVREFKNLSAENKERFQKIYHSTINNQFYFDWQCNSCVIDGMTRLYTELAPFEPKLIDLLPSAKAE
jgi:hypothetical protein